MINCHNCKYADFEKGRCTQLLTTLPVVCPHAVEKSPWISVNDQLPDLHKDSFDDGKEFVEYLVSEPKLVIFNYDEIAVSYYEVDEDTGFKGWVDYHSNTLHSVTHWMELPKLPALK